MKLTKKEEVMLKEKFSNISNILDKMQKEMFDAFDSGAEFVIRMMRESIAENSMDGFVGVSNRGILDHLNYIEEIIGKRRKG